MIKRCILGQVPCEEIPATRTAAQLDNCKRLIRLTRELVGPEPPGSHLGILVVRGEDGRPGYTVAYTYGPGEDCEDYRACLDWSLPLRWATGGRPPLLKRSLPTQLLGTTGMEVGA